MTSKAALASAVKVTDKVLEAKWGKPLIANGFTAIPDAIFRNQKALKLKPLDVLILLHLASYWWKPSENPWPAKGTIADAIDVDPRTVQRAIKKMEDLGYVKRIERKRSINCATCAADSHVIGVGSICAVDQPGGSAMFQGSRAS